MSLPTAKNLTSVSQRGDDRLLKQKTFIVHKATKCTEIRTNTYIPERFKY